MNDNAFYHSSLQSGDAGTEHLERLDLCCLSPKFSLCPVGRKAHGAEVEGAVLSRTASQCRCHADPGLTRIHKVRQQDQGVVDAIG